MLTIPALLLAAPLLLAPLGTSAPDARQESIGSEQTMTVEQCMEQLEAYGVWYAHEAFGWVWQPHDVPPWWQPFSVGEWIVTQDGSPFWRSGYPFGWAAEHYGGWTFDQQYGWLWVPGEEWSPAPVSWRAGGDIVGWAPPIAAGPEGTEQSPCEQDAFAWIFVRGEVLLKTTNFVADEKALLASDVHGTWRTDEDTADGVHRDRIPEPRNANLLGVTRCLGPGEVNASFDACVRAAGRTTIGPPIDFVTTRGQLGTGRVTNGILPAYAPRFTGQLPPLSSARRVIRSNTVQRNTGAQTPYDAYRAQRQALDAHHQSQDAAMRSMHAQDATTPPVAGMSPEQISEWQRREHMEMQRMTARQRRLLEAQQERNMSSQPGGAPAESSGG